MQGFLFFILATDTLAIIIIIIIIMWEAECSVIVAITRSEPELFHHDPSHDLHFIGLDLAHTVLQFQERAHIVWVRTAPIMLFPTPAS